MLDNSLLIAPFCPPEDDGDTFIYTELLDRAKKKGNNGHRILKTFYHRSVEEFWGQFPVIRRLCDVTLIRACTRLSHKSYEQVGIQHTRMVVEASLTKNWLGMKTLYNRACGITPPIKNKKFWLFDVDVVNDATLEFGKRINEDGNLMMTIPSKKGLHYIVKPFDKRTIVQYYQDLGMILIIKESLELDIQHEWMTLHRDNPTNLYIPDGAD